VTPGDVERHGFAVRAEDGWPNGEERIAGITCDDIDLAIHACVAGELLACLPDESAAGHDLHRIEAVPVDAVPLAAVFRAPVGRVRPSVTDRIVELLRSGPTG